MLSSLRELQQNAYRAIVLEDDARSRGLNVTRLGVYRNNARETFRKTLAATYPVVHRLVGEQCFRGLAYSYSHDFPSRSGDLGQYGAEFATLLEIYYRDSAFAYLADVARLEWACAETETAADGISLDLRELAQVPAEECARLSFALRAPARLLSSRFPIFSIWEAHQRDEVEAVPLRNGAEHVLVTRRRGLRLYRLDAGTFAFARSLADGESLSDAVSAGETASSGFAVKEALETLVQLNVLASFRLLAAAID
jgi:hypothetical protein